MKVGDLVMRTYGDAPRPLAIIVGWYEYGTPGVLALVLWTGEKHPVSIGTKYLEVVSENR